jgi:hypothetical protein
MYSDVIQQNPSERKSLLNGRIWHNKYSNAVNDQYFLTNTFLKGYVTFNGRKFSNLDLQYDIVDDELILRTESYPVIILNKEMVDSFTFVSGSRIYHIINFGNDTSSVLRGYANVLYNGPSALFVKYRKTFYPLAVDGRYDLFIQEHAIYLMKGTEILFVNGKRRLLKLLEDKKNEIRHYVKSNGIKLQYKDPLSFIPVMMYYDSLRE